VKRKKKKCTEQGKWCAKNNNNYFFICISVSSTGVTFLFGHWGIVMFDIPQFLEGESFL
jgi:hypothetical protein